MQEEQDKTTWFCLMNHIILSHSSCIHDQNVRFKIYLSQKDETPPKLHMVRVCNNFYTPYVTFFSFLTADKFLTYTNGFLAQIDS